MVIIGARLVGSPGLKHTGCLSSTIENQLGGDDLSGKVKLNVDPLPTSLSTQIFPPCSFTNFLAKATLSPVPSLRDEQQGQRMFFTATTLPELNNYGKRNAAT